MNYPAHIPRRAVAHAIGLTLFMLAGRESIAQTQLYRFEHLSVEQGLSHNAVSAIAQDRQGFLWIGTQDGLNRFDGTRFTIFRGNVRDSLALSTSNIRSLLADRNGNVWISTFNYGIHRFDPSTGTFTHYAHRPTDPRSLSSNAIECMYEDGSGTIWVGTDNGLNRVDTATGLCDRFAIPTSDSASNASSLVTALYDDTKGSLWIVYENGIAVLDYATDSIRHVYNLRTKARWITGDEVGNVWIGTERSILRYNQESRSFTITGARHELKYDLVFTTLMDVSGLLWSNSSRGLYRYDPRTNSSAFFPFDSTGANLRHYSLRALGVDRSGIVWIGTYNGIYKLMPAAKHFNLHRFLGTREGRIDRNNVRSFAEDRTGAIWIATLDGVYRFDPRTKHEQHYSRRQSGLSMIASTAFWSILVDATSSRLAVLADAYRFWFPFDGDLRSPVVSMTYPELDSLIKQTGYTVDAMLQDRTGTIWIGFRTRGVARFDPRQGNVRRFLPDPDNPTRLNAGAIFAICETLDGSVWFATNGGGLNKFDRQAETFTRYLSDPTNPKSIADNGVLSLLPDENGILWVGTYAGLDRFDTKRGTFDHFTMKDGLANNVIYGILKDDKGNLWLSSNRGITRFNPATGLVKNYSLANGIQDYEYNHNACLKASTGEMYFGGINGFNVFHPDSMKDNPYVPNVVLVDLKILNKSVQPGPTEPRVRKAIPMTQELLLSYDDAALTFEFAALEFTDPSLNQFAYMLEGFDGEWQYVGTKREVTYTNLDPGRYTLRAKASNNDGVWNETGTGITISIAPPWWMTWWFRGIVVIFFLSVGPIVYYRRVTGLKKEYALQQEFSRRLIDSQEQERRRIATELHDSIGQDLLVIKNRTYLARQAVSVGSKVEEQLDHITTTVTQALQNVRQIARNLRPYHLDRVGLTGALRSTFENVAQASTIAFNIQVNPIDNLFPPDKKDMEVNVFRIVQESVNNILKHSEATSARIQIGAAGHRLSILIEDNGKGFDPSTIQSAQSKAGLGVSGISERVKMLGGTYTLESSPGAGTKVTVTVPLEPGVSS